MKKIKRLLLKIINFLKKLFGLLDTPEVKGFWFQLQPTYIFNEPGVFYSEKYLTQDFRIGHRVLDDKNDMYVVVGITSEKPVEEKDVKLYTLTGLKVTLLK